MNDLQGFPVIPTAAEIADEIILRLASAAGTDWESFADELVHVLNDGNQAGTLLLLSYAKGCHALAQIEREHGRIFEAALAHAAGQELLRRAVATLEMPLPKGETKH
jgi:hypothetical protein